LDNANKLNAIAGSVKAEGWQWVNVDMDADYSTLSAYSRQQLGHAELAEEVQHQRGTEEPNLPATLDALFIWSNMHGLASISNSPAVATLGLPRSTIDQMIPHAMQRLGGALRP
jgi:hypothetical protein